MAFVVVPAVTVTEVGAAAEANGIVKFWFTGSVFAQQFVPHGSYVTSPWTLMVATYWPVPTAEIPTTENFGANTGGVAAQHGEQSDFVRFVMK